MRNGAFVLFGLLLALPCGAQRSVPRTHKSEQERGILALTRKALPAVGLIVVSDGTGKVTAQGSGFMVSSDGEFVTNYHVIEGAASAVIKFPNGAFYGVDGVLTLDPDQDLAVLKAAGKGFPFLTLGRSEDVQAGQTVVAIGSPLSLEATVSSGIVSGVRTIGKGNLKVIQTTAAISPGSSGGALLNLDGQVIGVTAYRLQKGENLNFAIAADYLKPLLVSKTVTPFVPHADEANNETPSQQEPDEALSDIPRAWSGRGPNETTYVTVDKNLLLERILDAPNAPVGVECSCVTKRDGDRWIGRCECKERFGFGNSARYDCPLELGEVVTHVSKDAIWGKSQFWDQPNPSGCPTPSTRWLPFLLVPKE